MKDNNFGTGWEKEPSLQDLKSDLDLARSPHDSQKAKIADWLENLHVTRKINTPKGRSGIQPKLIRRNNEWRYTSLSEPFLNTPDIFNVDPITAEDVEAARMNEMVLNNQFNTKIDKVSFIDRYVRKCVDEGTVIVRVGWNYSTQLRTMVYPEFEIQPTDNPRHIAELERAAQMSPEALPEEMIEALIQSTDSGIPHYPVKVGTQESVETVVQKNHPTIEVCDTENVIIDPSCGGDLDAAEFVVYSFETSLSDLEKAGKYQNLDQIEPESHGVLDDGNHSSNWAENGFTFNDKPRQKMVAYEYWGYWDIDGSGETRPIVATWVGSTLIRLEENPYPDGKHPFVAVPYLPVDGSVHGEPDGELIIDNQKVVGAVTRGIIDTMARSANGQTGVRKGALDPLNRRRFDAGMDYEFNDMGDAQNSIHMHQYPEIPMTAYNMLSMQQQEAESLTGVKAFAQGITGSGLGETATHAQGALDAAARRELGILRRLSEGLKKAARKMIAMNQVFLSEEEVIRITNDVFTTIRRDDLSGSFDLRLSISTAEADEQKAKELAFMLQTTGQNFGLDMYKLILSEIADLRKMPHLADNIRKYQPEPDPTQLLEQQKLQLEIQEMQVNIQKTQAEIQKILAEAGNKTADTDRKNLDYVEQENGVNHAREIEKNQAQARGNMQLKAFEKMLDTPQPETQTSQENPQ
ncbi:portal protein [Vibrio phage vB_VhaP_PG11]|nr:portal protein [Vibrio phage vB_VhaP_PG11]